MILPPLGGELPGLSRRVTCHGAPLELPSRPWRDCRNPTKEQVMVKQWHVNDEITTMKKHQGETNQRLDAILAALQETNRLLEHLAQVTGAAR